MTDDPLVDALNKTAENVIRIAYRAAFDTLLRRIYRTAGAEHELSYYHQ